MEMLQLNDLLPEELWEKYWTILGDEHEELSNGTEYVIFEHYCTNTACDCKSVMADIQEIGSDGKATGKSIARIDYNWSSKKTACDPTFSNGAPKTKIASNLLDVYKKYIHNPEYIAKVQCEYTRVKSLIADRRLQQAINPTKNMGRNDPCPCGSNKKYKKCCLKN